MTYDDWHRQERGFGTVAVATALIGIVTAAVLAVAF